MSTFTFFIALIRTHLFEKNCFRTEKLTQNIDLLIIVVPVNFNLYQTTINVLTFHQTYISGISTREIINSP